MEGTFSMFSGGSVPSLDSYIRDPSIRLFYLATTTYSGSSMHGFAQRVETWSQRNGVSTSSARSDRDFRLSSMGAHSKQRNVVTLGLGIFRASPHPILTFYFSRSV